MAEVTNERIYEVLKRLQSDTAEVKAELREINVRLNGMQIHVIALQQDVQKIYTILGRHDARLDRIERRLNLDEVA